VSSWRNPGTSRGGATSKCKFEFEAHLSLHVIGEEVWAWSCSKFACGSHWFSKKFQPRAASTTTWFLREASTNTINLDVVCCFFRVLWCFEWHVAPPRLAKNFSFHVVSEEVWAWSTSLENTGYRETNSIKRSSQNSCGRLCSVVNLAWRWNFWQFNSSHRNLQTMSGFMLSIQFEQLFQKQQKAAWGSAQSSNFLRRHENLRQVQTQMRFTPKLPHRWHGNLHQLHHENLDELHAQTSSPTTRKLASASSSNSLMKT
jgi:hypothetical protein